MRIQFRRFTAGRRGEEEESRQVSEWLIKDDDSPGLDTGPAQNRRVHIIQISKLTGSTLFRALMRWYFNFESRHPEKIQTYNKAIPWNSTAFVSKCQSTIFSFFPPFLLPHVFQSFITHGTATERKKKPYISCIGHCFWLKLKLLCGLHQRANEEEFQSTLTTTIFLPNGSESKKKKRQSLYRRIKYFMAQNLFVSG